MPGRGRLPRASALGQALKNRVGVVDAAGPGASGGGGEGGPEAGVFGEVWVGGEVWAWGAVGEDLGAEFCGTHLRLRYSRRRRWGTRLFFGAKVFRVLADEVYGGLERGAVDVDLDEVVVEDAADGAAGEGFRGDVADAGSGGDAGEAGVGEDGYVFAEGEGFEGGGDLVDLLHAGAEGAAADEDEDVAVADGAGFDGLDGCGFGGEDAGGTGVFVAVLGVDEGGVDGGGFDDGALRGEVAGGKAHGGGEALGAGSVGEKMTSSGSMWSRSRRRCLRAWRRSDSAHQLRFSSRVWPETVRTEVSRRPAERRWSMVSGTAPARKTWAVAKPRGPLGRASTRRGVARFIAVQSATVGRRSLAAWAMAGMWRRRLVEPPKAAWRTMALRIAASVRMCCCGDVLRGEAEQGAGGAGGGVEPDGLATGGEGGVGEAEAEGFGDDLGGGGGAEELAASAGGGAGSAAGFCGVFEGDFALGEAGAETTRHQLVKTSLSWSLSWPARAASAGVTVDPKSVQIQSGPAHGVTQVDPATGDITYIPAANFVGTDSFVYTVDDSAGVVSNAATVSIRVTGGPAVRRRITTHAATIHGVEGSAISNPTIGSFTDGDANGNFEAIVDFGDGTVSPATIKEAGGRFSVIAPRTLMPVKVATRSRSAFQTAMGETRKLNHQR